MELYNENEVTKLMKDKKKFLFVFFAILFIALAVFIPLCFFINNSNKVAIIIVDSFVLSIAFCDLLYLLINIHTRNNDLIRHYAKIISSDKKEVNFVVISDDGFMTYSRNIKVRTYLVMIDGKQFNIYVPNNFDGFKINAAYKCLMVNNFVYSYEEV